MPTTRTYIRHPHRGALSHDQEMELWLGPSHRGSAFGSREEMRQAWLRHRDGLMAAWAKHSKRPNGWWEFEAPFPRPDSERERSTLYNAGLLTEAERVELLAFWRREFERAQPADFRMCLGPERWLQGAAARREHYRWADIPADLVKRWTGEHKRRARTIRRLVPA
jgi:hypothetical protein